MALCAIKQLEEKNVGNQITFMVWSDRMDLVALANVKGEVSLHRLTWTRAWVLSPPKEGLAVKGICWRPDGKIIAIAYTSGQVLLVKVENVEILLTIEIQSEVSCLYWTQEKHENPPKEQQTEEDDNNDYMKYIDFSNKFLSDPPLQAFDSSDSSIEEQKLNILQANQLNLLLMGTTEGFVQINIFGSFPCAVVDLTENSQIESTCTVENVHLTEDLSEIYVTTRDKNHNVNVSIVDSGLFKTHTKELYAIAVKSVKIVSLINYISNTIITITETWESILLEMDHKLSKYASKVAEGGVTADFLDLLMFGICSNEMEEFLVHDLTKKGLEKFGQTIEMSYANIQKLLLKYVTKFGQNITYHLAELRGMARLEHRYKKLGILEDLITETISANGAFLIKGGEMQQIINHSIINYQAFFRWLFTAIMLLMDEQIPSDIPKMTQQDLAYITEFLQNFDYIGQKTDGTKQGGFKMERLGQYLADSPLTIEPNMAGNEWAQFLKENQCLKEHPNILKHYENLSLVQQFNELKVSVEKIFESPKNIISKQFTSLRTINVFNCPDQLKSTQFNINKESVLLAFLLPTKHINLLHIQNGSLRTAKIFFSQDNMPSYNYRVLDLKFYSSFILSLLLQEDNPNKIAVLYQFPVLTVLDNLLNIGAVDDICGANIPEINGSQFGPKIFKTIEGMPATELAVSGTRKVGIVLSENRRKVRLFEMEGEEEEDEDADMSSKENDMSIGEGNSNAFDTNS